MPPARIVALHGLPSFGADAPLPASVPMSMGTKLFWTLSLTTVGYLFWATLQAPRSRKKAQA